MKQIIVITVCFLLVNNMFVNPCQAQRMSKGSWDILADVTFSAQYLEEYGAKYLVPEFGKTPIAYEGKILEITGYIIPADPEQDIYILSFFPYASCFFCGNAGPETIVQLVFEQKDKSRKRNYQIDDIRTFRGKLRLNKDDVEYTNYILEEAVEVK